MKWNYGKGIYLYHTGINELVDLPKEFLLWPPWAVLSQCLSAESNMFTKVIKTLCS